MRRPASWAGCVKLPIRNATRWCKKGDRLMKKNTSKKKTQEEGKQGFASYIGIDLGDKSSDVCVLDAAGEKREEFRLCMKAAEFQAYFATIGRSRVAVEAGGQSRWEAA